MENNRDGLLEQSGDLMFGDDFDLEKASTPMKTLKRLMHTAKHERLRLTVVLLSVVLFTALAIAAPAYSAGIINLLWGNIQSFRGLGEAFQVTWRQGGQQIFILYLLYFGSWVFYTLQSFLVLSFAEHLSLRFRTQLSEKLNRLPLAFFDRHKTGEILSRFTNGLDKMSEALQSGLRKLFTSLGLAADNRQSVGGRVPGVFPVSQSDGGADY